STINGLNRCLIIWQCKAQGRVADEDEFSGIKHRAYTGVFGSYINIAKAQGAAIGISLQHFLREIDIQCKIERVRILACIYNPSGCKTCNGTPVVGKNQLLSARLLSHIVIPSKLTGCRNKKCKLIYIS